MLLSCSSKSATPSKLPWAMAYLSWHSSMLPATNRLEADVKAVMSALDC
jgi:hypothetical protein